jgi:hypothetical protein
MMNGQYIKMNINGASTITSDVSTVIDIWYVRGNTFPPYMLYSECFDEPVEMIDQLSVRPTWHVAYLLAARPNPQPYDDIIYKDSV